MVTTCAEVLGIWEWLSCKPRLAAMSASLGYVNIWEIFWEVHSVSWDRPFVWKSCWAWLWWPCVLGGLGSQTWHLPALQAVWGKVCIKEQRCLPALCLKIAAPSSLTLMPDNSVPFYTDMFLCLISLAAPSPFQAVALTLEPEQVSL